MTDKEGQEPQLQKKIKPNQEEEEGGEEEETKKKDEQDEKSDGEDENNDGNNDTNQGEGKQEGKQKMLANFAEDPINNEQIINDFKQMVTYKYRQYQLKNLMEDENEANNPELLALSQDLQETIQQQEEKLQKINKQYLFSIDILDDTHVNRLAKVYYEKDNKWYHAQILSIKPEEQTADIQFVGYKDVLTMHAIYVRLMEIPLVEQFQAGYQCEAIYPEDGKYYPCIIEKITEDKNYIVKFKRYNNKETVSLYHLRESKKAKELNKIKKRNFQDLTEFKVPENLKILPNDNDQERQTKKKKVKSLKQSFKQAQIEKEQEDKQKLWQQFKQEGQKKKSGYFRDTKESIFKSPETIEGKVGVVNSGLGMTNFNARSKIQLQDNSHLSRLF